MNRKPDDPPVPDPAAIAALASLAFGPANPGTAVDAGVTRHLAFLAIEALELDLSDPEQRDFGDYELLEKLGAGGMGVVYRARQKSLDREVAVKLLSAGPWASKDFIERFQREAQSAARLQHPNIVAIHEIGTRDELNYFSMALVEGSNLAQHLAQDGPMPVHKAARLVRTIAEALHYAHRLGVLHLDLKPGNILIDASGEPRIADFGLARRIDSTLAAESHEVSGTPSYMAPEQVELRRHKLSVATDIYGLGAILYELLTGHPPFEATSPRETLSLVLDGQLRRPRRYRADLSPDLEAICLKCLAKEPGERYPSAQALADDLGRYLEGRAVSVRPLNAMQRLQRWMLREPRLAGAISLGVLALMVGLGVALVQRERAQDSAAASRQQTWQTRGDAAWRLVSAGRTAEALPLLVDNLREREAHDDADGVALERLRLGTLQHTSAQLIDAIETGGLGRALDISRDGSRVAVADMDEGESVRLFAVDDGRLLWTAATATHTHFRAVGLPLTRVNFSPDGRYLMTATWEPPTFLTPHGRNNVLIDASNGQVIVPPAEVFADFYDATYGADGRYAVLRDGSGSARFFRVDGWSARSTPRQTGGGIGGSWIVGNEGRFVGFSIRHRIDLLDTGTLLPRFSHQFDSATAPTHWTAQPAGGLLALGHADGTVHLLDTASPTLRALRPAPPDPINTLAFSMDGTWLLASAGGRIFLWDVASGQGGPLPSTRPIQAWRLQADAASGTVFAFESSDAMLWRLPGSDRSPIRQRIAEAHEVVTQFGFGKSLPRNAAAYAPSARLAASVTRSGELRLWRWRDGDVLQARTSAIVGDELHFDGRHVLAVDGDTVRVVEIPGERQAGPALVHPQPVSFAAFTPDGHTLVTASGRVLRAFDWRTGQPRFAPIVLDGSPQRIAINPDSTHLLVSIGAYRNDRYHELGSTFDLHDGRMLAHDVPLPGPVAGQRFSPNGRHLVHWRYGEAQVRDAVSLAATGEVLRFGPDMVEERNTGRVYRVSPAQGETPINDAAVTDDGARAVMIVRGVEPETPRLLEVGAGSGGILHQRTLPTGWVSRLWPRGQIHELSIWEGTSGRTQWLDSRSGQGPMPHAGGYMLHAQATSADGRWLAVTSSQGVLLVDRSDHAWATPVLTVSLPFDDYIVQLAFAADGSGLLARTERGHWAWWPLAAETRPLVQLEEQLARLDPNPTDSGQAPAAPTADERAALRADDPGGPAVAGVAATAASIRLPPVPARPAATGWAMIDLRPFQNMPEATSWYSGLRAWLPRGHQHLLDVDFDIAGIVMLSMPSAPLANEGFPAATAAIPVPQPRFDAVHVLLGGCCPMPGNQEGAYAYVTLRYTDGSQARLPIMHRRDMWFLGEEPGDNGRARIAWTVAAPGEDPAYFHAPRLANPHPERDVDTIKLEASEHFGSGPMFLAATLELPDGEAPGSATRAEAR